MTTDLDTEEVRPGDAIPVAALGHTPALDGIRAVAVIAVLMFHGDVPGLGGGFLGVSVFFTLSGFLITSLLLRQWGSTGTIDLRRFWSRRFRRLLPASWLTMALVVTMGALGVWDAEQLRMLRGDVPWALGELVNWHFIWSGTSYGDSFSSPSPLEHFWSLAIEQQFYVLLPAIVVGLLVARRSAGPTRRLRELAVVLAMLALASAVANGVLAGDSVDRAYFGTDTRAAELLIGALLACGTLRRFSLRSTRTRGVAFGAGVLGLAALAWLFHVAELDSAWLYPWGLLLTAASTAAIIVAGLQTGPISSLLASSPLPAIGAVSYGVYLLHWPVFLWLSPARTGWDTAPLFALRVAVSFGAAIVMLRVVERPIRSGRRLRTPAVRVAMPLAAAALLVASFAVTSDLPPPPDFLQPRDPEALQIREPASTAVPSTAVPSTAVPSTAPGDPGAQPLATAPPAPPVRPTRVLLVGDSVAASLETALGDALTARGVAFATAATPGCGVLTGDPATEDGQPLDIVAACSAAIPRNQSSAVARAGPDLVVALSTWEAADRIVDGQFHRIGTPEGDAVLRVLYSETLNRLAIDGAAVVLVTVPDNVDGRTRPADPDTNARLRLLNALIGVAVADHPGRMATLSLDRIVCPVSPCPTEVEGITLRPADGTHFDEPVGARFVAERLADQIVELDLSRL